MSTNNSSIPRRLPYGILTKILSEAARQEPWRLPMLTQVSKESSAALSRLLFQRLHLRSISQLDAVNQCGWPYASQNKQLSLYLHHFIDATGIDYDADESYDNRKKKIYDEDEYEVDYQNNQMDKHFEFYYMLKEQFGEINVEYRKKITTLGVRLMPGFDPIDFLGLWACKLLPNLSRLYVDLSMLPPHEVLGEDEDEDGEDLTPWPKDATFSPVDIDEVEPEGKDDIYPKDNENKLEVFALLGCHAEEQERDYGAPHGVNEFIGLYKGGVETVKKNFKKLKRLFLFSLSSHQSADDLEGELYRVANAFEEDTVVELIFHILIRDRKKTTLDKEASEIFKLSNGGLFIKSIVVDPPVGDLDTIALMQRVIDEIEAEWVPEEFSGYRWSPSTRPKYLIDIPKKSSFNNSELSSLSAPRLTWLQQQRDYRDDAQDQEDAYISFIMNECDGEQHREYMYENDYDDDDDDYY